MFAEVENVSGQA